MKPLFTALSGDNNSGLRQIYVLILGAIIGFLPTLVLTTFQIQRQADVQRKQFLLDKRIAALKDFTSALNSDGELFAKFDLYEMAVSASMKESPSDSEIQKVQTLGDDLVILQNRYVAALRTQTTIVNALFGCDIPPLPFAQPDMPRHFAFKGKTLKERRAELQETGTLLIGKTHELKAKLLELLSAYYETLGTLQGALQIS